MRASILNEECARALEQQPESAGEIGSDFPNSPEEQLVVGAQSGQT